jgi:DNA polymerase-3 subunit delta'
MSREQSLAVHPDTHAALDSFAQAPSHAVGLVGGAGLGKTILAKQLAAQLLNLTLTELQLYPYFRTIMPENGAISIATIREMRSFFTLVVPTRRKGQTDRLLLIEDADTMTREAQNALLKLLEEPPEDSVCIVTLAKLHQLLPTVRSRLQVIQVHAPQHDDIVQAFRGLSVEPEAISRALLASGGNIATAHASLIEPVDSETESPLALVKNVLAADTFTRLAMADSIAKNKDTADSFIDSLVLVSSASLELAAKTKEEQKMQRWQKTLAAAYIAQTAYNQNANQKLVLTELMLSL